MFRLFVFFAILLFYGTTIASEDLNTHKSVRVKDSGVTVVPAYKVPRGESTAENTPTTRSSFDNNKELIIQYPNPEKCKEELAEQLPPDPGQVGKETITGIDSDRDCIRDDLELIISERLPGEKHHEARRYLYIHAIWLGELLKENPTVEEMHEVSNYLYGTSKCAREILGDTIETKKLLDWIFASNLNTFPRSYRYIDNNGLLGGTTTRGTLTILCE